MNIFKRLFRIGQAEIHAAIDKMEDPVKMTEQGSRELRNDIAKATEAYAQVKAVAIRAKNDKDNALKEAFNYEQKAILILQKSQNQELEETKAETLAREALSLKRQFAEEAIRLSQQADLHDQSCIEMQTNIMILQENLNKWERELKTIKAKAKVSSATLMVNKQLAQIDSNNTLAMLERMRSKVEDQDALASAYGDIARTRVDAKTAIDNFLNDNSTTIDIELEEIKRNLGT